MKIAIIDTGISKNEIKDTFDVQHFTIIDNRVIENYREPLDKHGSECFNELKSILKSNEIKILDFNILNTKNELEVDNIILSIKKAIEKRVDIINISLGTINFSDELYNICQEANQNNIVIVAASSHTHTISFPADFDNVISVSVNNNQHEEVKSVNFSSVSINMRDCIICEGEDKFDFSSSSIASARFTGMLCNEFLKNILLDKKRLLLKKFNINLINKTENEPTRKLLVNEYDKILKNNRIAVVVFPYKKINEINFEFLPKNIVAYYNFDENRFYNIKHHRIEKDFDLILIINTLYYDIEIPRNINENFKNYKIIALGNFTNYNGNHYLNDYKAYKSFNLSILEAPIIAISSICSELHKIEILSSLLNEFRKDNFKIGSVTNNPIGILENSDVFYFPVNVKFPDIVYSINRYMYLVEMYRDIDAWLINIGGGISIINSLNTYNFGKLVDAYLSASNIDIMILCITPSISVEFLKRQISYLYKNNVEKVFLVLAHKDINPATVDYRNGIQTYLIDEEKYLLSLNYLRNNIDEEILTIDDVKNGKLYRNIIDTLS